MTVHIRDTELDAAEEVYDRRYDVAKAVLYWSSGFIMASALGWLAQVMS